MCKHVMQIYNDDELLNDVACHGVPKYEKEQRRKEETPCCSLKFEDFLTDGATKRDCEGGSGRGDESNALRQRFF